MVGVKLNALVPALPISSGLSVVNHPELVGVPRQDNPPCRTPLTTLKRGSKCGDFARGFFGIDPPPLALGVAGGSLRSSKRPLAASEGDIRGSEVGVSEKGTGIELPPKVFVCIVRIKC